MAPGMVKSFELPAVPTGLMNVTDPDSRVVRTQGQPGMQSYNAQLAVNARQTIVAARSRPSHRTSGTYEEGGLFVTDAVDPWSPALYRSAVTTLNRQGADISRGMNNGMTQDTSPDLSVSSTALRSSCG